MTFVFVPLGIGKQWKQLQCHVPEEDFGGNRVDDPLEQLAGSVPAVVHLGQVC